MKKWLVVWMSLVILLVTGCNTTNQNYTPIAASGENYNRNTVCTNLRSQLQFNADQGYSATNMGSNQIKQQQLLAAYQANGCDK